MSSCLSFAISRSKPFSAAAWVKILETFLRWFIRFIIIALILFVFLSDRERGILNVKRLAQETIEEDSEMPAAKMQPQPRRAASIAATSIFFICIIASNARLAAAGSGPDIALV